MQKINYGRAAISALPACAVLLACEFALLGLLGPSMMAARAAARMPAFVPRPILSMVELFATGFLLVWTYAAIRPRFGAGILTAVRSGAAVWSCLGGIVTIHMMTDNFGMPDWLLMAVAAAMLPSLIAASVAGAWVYRE